ncbi:lactosylceramide 4-alpha-galactosyltransferase-like [Palaemon carinicauda]|uniref:lactosylceramide 4-alpha-galactosyltransferase-like n=1 Tax=Palaemon carinicauda TaxID=392227 RepID=UPI0035B57A7C
MGNKRNSIRDFSRIWKVKRFFAVLVFLGVTYSFASHGFYVAERQHQRLLRRSIAIQEVQSHQRSLGVNETFLNAADYAMKGLVSGNRNGSVFCSHKSASGDSSLLRLSDFFRNETEWKKEGAFNIFLIETSCNSKPKYRSWCSAESMAQQNPKAIVWYIFTSPEVDLSDGLVEQLLQKYKNLRLATVHLDDVFEGTPLEELYRTSAWHSNGTLWPAANLSNMMRIAMVWQAGGFYSDSDVICISPVTELKNVIGLASFNLVNGANFHFDRHHPMVKKFMLYLNEHFNPFVWGKNGPQTVSAVLRSVCNENILYQGLVCDNTKILSHTAFNPIQPHQRSMLFLATAVQDLRKRFQGSYAIHFWNRETRIYPVVKESGTIYDLASKNFCPFSRELATKKSRIY